jgi:hypothetical protein
MTNSSANSHTIEIFSHLDVVARGDEPLSELGRRQAEYMAEELAVGRPILAVYANANIRCRQSVEPLAERLGLAIQDVPGFADKFDLRGHRSGERHPLANAWLAGSAYTNLERIRAELPAGRAVICCIAEVAPALAAFVAGVANTPVLPTIESHHGGVYTIVFDEDGVTCSQREPAPSFPTASSELSRRGQRMPN